MSDNSIYIALSKQMAQFRQMDLHAHNIANATTTGFKGEKMIFTDYLVDDGNYYKNAFAQDIATWRNTREGAMEMTGEKFDVAIQGDGYFMVETPLGVRYTRAGNFNLDGNGILITADGYPVLDAGGARIEFLPEDTGVVISEEGLIQVGAEERGQLGVVRFENEQMLERLNSALYQSDVPPLPAENYRILQGTIESSNVQPVMEMTAMMKTSRSVSSTNKIINAIYELQRQTVRTYTESQR